MNSFSRIQFKGIFLRSTVLLKAWGQVDTAFALFFGFEAMLCTASNKLILSSKTMPPSKTFNSPDTLEIGVDEAGRGPSFGRMYTAAVIWSPTLTSHLIDDSKKLKNPAHLKAARDFVVENATAWSIDYATEQEIDKFNPLQADMRSMHRAIRGCNLIPDVILVDGNYFNIYSDQNGDPVDHITVIKGDAEYYSIAAASILAKYEHDKYIHELCDQYPVLDERYNLRKNVGYMTAAHKEGIQKHGISQFHRKTFGPCKNRELNPV